MGGGRVGHASRHWQQNASYWPTNTRRLGQDRRIVGPVDGRRGLLESRQSPGFQVSPLRGLRTSLCLARWRIRFEVLPHWPIVMGRKQRHRFLVALLEGDPAMFVGYLGYVEADDQKAAIEGVQDRGSTDNSKPLNTPSARARCSSPGPDASDLGT